jgi:hypothetical protein
MLKYISNFINCISVIIALNCAAQYLYYLQIPFIFIISRIYNVSNTELFASIIYSTFLTKYTYSVYTIIPIIINIVIIICEQQIKTFDMLKYCAFFKTCIFEYLVIFLILDMYQSSLFQYVILFFVLKLISENIIKSLSDNELIANICVNKKNRHIATSHIQFILELFNMCFYASVSYVYNIYFEYNIRYSLLSIFLKKQKKNNVKINMDDDIDIN